MEYMKINQDTLKFVDAYATSLKSRDNLRMFK